jgi:hypothetical protein
VDSPVTRQPNAIDFWRGFALITIFINHIPGLYFEAFTHRNYSISDSADLFVFLAGWALRLSLGSTNPAPTGRVLSLLGGRIVKIYAAQLLMCCIAIAMLAMAAKLLENPALLEWHNAAAIFYDPVNAHIGLALLTYQLGYFDILPLYVVLMMLAPAIILVHRLLPGVLLPLSLGIYLCALIFEVSPQSWPTSGTWFFNPLAWQFLFVLGFLLGGGDDGIGRAARRYITPLRIAAAPMVVLGALMMQLDWWPDPTAMPEPKLLFIAMKTYMTPLRLIQFLALAAVFSAVYPLIARLSPALSQFLSKLGRNSLNVFCVGSLLSLAFQIVRFVYERSIMVDTAILLTGIGLLGFTAWVSEWRGATSSARSAQSVSYGR